MREKFQRGSRAPRLPPFNDLGEQSFDVIQASEDTRKPAAAVMARGCALRGLGRRRWSAKDHNRLLAQVAILLR